MRNTSAIMGIIFIVSGCAEMNGGYGFGKGSGSAGKNKTITMKEGVSLYRFISPPNPHLDWRQQYDIRESEVDFDIKEYQFYNINSGWVNLQQNFIVVPQKFGNVAPQSSALYTTSEQDDADRKVNWRSSGLDIYLSALQGKQTLAQAHHKYFSSFYPNATVLAQVQRNVKGIQCMQTKAEYKGHYLVELQCPVFFRNTFGTITYLMNINQKLTEQDFYGPPGVLEFYVKKYGEVEGTKLFKRDQLTDSIAESGAKNAKEYLDYHMPAFNHMVDTLEFIEPASQKVPAGFSLDEQFKRMQDPKWKL